MDNAPQHTGARVRRYIKENRDIRAIALPVATPELNATEEYWHQLKQNVVVSTHYEDADTMRNAIRVYPYLQAQTGHHEIHLQRIAVAENNMIGSISCLQGE